MPRLKFIGAIALLTAVSALQARAAAPALPPDVVAADTVAVIHLEAAHFSPDQLKAAATAILGANANKVDEPLKKFAEKYDKAAAAGAEALTMVVGAPKKPDPAAPAPAEPAPPKSDSNGIVYVQLKAGADVKAIEAMITEDMKPEEKDKTQFDQVDNFLAVHEKGQTFPVKPDAVRTALFADALGTISDASIQIAFIPDEGTRAEMLKGAADAPKGLKDAAPLLANSKWMTVGITFGNAPGLTLTANAAAEADAKTLTDTINAGLADLKAQAANPGPDGNPIMAMAGPLIGQLVDSLKPAQTGTQVTVSVKTDTLKLIAGFAANLGMLGGGPGGPPPQ